MRNGAWVGLSLKLSGQQFFSSKDAGMKHVNTMIRQLLKYLLRFCSDRSVDRQEGQRRVPSTAGLSPLPWPMRS